MERLYHSVELDKEKCQGCTDCIKRCPTEAIRVRNGKAFILHEKCIDCGMCIKVCRNHAKIAATQRMDIIKNYAYKVAIPAPALYGQFKNMYNVNIILTAIKRMGFDEVFEVAAAAELITEATKRTLNEKKLPKPVISSACPAVVKLITMRFPDLIRHILPIISPMEAAAVIIKNHLENKGRKREDIGVFFISPCAAKHTNVLSPLGIDKSEVDGVISIQDIYMVLRNKVGGMDLKDLEVLAFSRGEGANWAITGGESTNLGLNSIAADGVENVIQVLEEVENGQLDDVDFIELLSCTGGCIGGPLTVANSFVAKNNLVKIQKAMSREGVKRVREMDIETDKVNYFFTEEIKPVVALRLDTDMSRAIIKMEKMNELIKQLPGIDCGACGAPNCAALAEDIVRGSANIEDCLFMLRSKVKLLAESMVELASKLPQTITTKEVGEADEAGGMGKEVV